METLGLWSCQDCGTSARRAADMEWRPPEPKWEAVCAAAGRAGGLSGPQRITLQALHAGHGAAGLGFTLVWLLICYAHVFPF